MSKRFRFQLIGFLSVIGVMILYMALPPFIEKIATSLAFAFILGLAFPAYLPRQKRKLVQSSNL
jgi:hypothetical protein